MAPNGSARCRSNVAVATGIAVPPSTWRALVSRASLGKQKSFESSFERSSRRRMRAGTSSHRIVRVSPLHQMKPVGVQNSDASHAALRLYS